MAIPLKVRLAVPFQGNLLFAGFLPETKEEALQVQLLEGRYEVQVYVSNRREQLAHIADVPTNRDEMKNYALWCSGLTFEVDVRAADSQVIDALEKGRITDATETFGRELFEVVAWIHTRLVDYFRNVAKQAWVKPLLPEFGSYPHPPKYPETMHSPQIFMNGWAAQWMDKEGKWRRLSIGAQRFNAVGSFQDGIDKGDWTALKAFIEEGKTVPMRKVLLANSIQHANEQNPRLAILESVVALESYIKQILPRVIVRLPGAPDISQNSLDGLLQKAGLRAVTAVVFPIIKDAARLSDLDISAAMDAVTLRNQIVHNAKRTVEPAEAWKCVRGVVNICESFEMWANAQGPESHDNK